MHALGVSKMLRMNHLTTLFKKISLFQNFKIGQYQPFKHMSCFYFSNICYYTCKKNDLLTFKSEK